MWKGALQSAPQSKRFEVKVRAHYRQASPSLSLLGGVGRRAEKTTAFFFFFKTPLIKESSVEGLKEKNLSFLNEQTSCFKGNY